MTPDALLGWVNASIYHLRMGVGPFGAVAGGVLGGAIGPRETLAIAVVGSTLGGLWILSSPVRKLGSITEVMSG